MPRCPGQDLRYWTPKDIYEIACVACDTKIEFWKDEPMRICPGCKREVRNPRIDLGCAKWCKYANECIGKAVGAEPVPPVIDRLELLLEGRFAGKLAATRIHKFYELAQQFLSSEKAEPCVVQAGAVLAGAFIDSGQNLNDCKAECIAMLERSGVEAQIAKRIFENSAAAVCGNELQTAECDIITDIIKLDQLAMTGQAQEFKFKTLTAQKLAKSEK
jgi:hypothetical protein